MSLFALTSNLLIFQDGHIQVNFPNPVYGDAPYTVQTGSCGQVGERIYATPGYFINLGGASTEFYGPPGEWSLKKYIYR